MSDQIRPTSLAGSTKASVLSLLAEPPVGWKAVPHYAVFRRIRRVGHEELPLLSVYRDLGIVPRKGRDDNHNRPSDDLSNYQRVNEGDLVINKMKAWQGSVGVSEYQGLVSPAYFVYEPIGSNHGRFLHYLLRSDVYTAAYGAISKGIRVDQWDLDPQEHSRLPVLLPSFDEQCRIAAFLDHETARIDELVREQKRLIALLWEQQKELVSHVVRRGLSPQVAMRDSRVEAIGSIPAHWSVMPLKRDVSLVTSGSRGWAAHYSDEGALFIRIGNLTRAGLGLDLADIQRVNVPSGSEGERTRVQAGDLLFSITAYLGSVAIAPEGLGPTYVSQHVALVRLRERHLSPAWVGYVTLSSIGGDYLNAEAYGGGKVQLSLEDIREMVLPVPPIAEQHAITKYLDNELQKLATLRGTAQQVITLLQERRAALISAAVTGQLDLSDWQAPESMAVAEVA